jgi:hypothetical protein
MALFLGNYSKVHNKVHGTFDLSVHSKVHGTFNLLMRLAMVSDMHFLNNETLASRRRLSAKPLASFRIRLAAGAMHFCGY